MSEVIKEPASTSITYCFGYEKMFYIVGKDYAYMTIFFTVTDGQPDRIVLGAIDREKRNLDGWKNAITKAFEKIGEAKYLLFRNTSFNFVMDTSDILPKVQYCRNVGEIDYRESFRAESLALANKMETILSNIRSNQTGLETAFAALSQLLTELGEAVKISVCL